MPPRKRGFWQRVGDAFRRTIFTTPERVPDVSFTPARKDKGPRVAPTVENYRYDAIDWDDHGPYPAQWGAPERELWDSEPNTVRDLYGADEWRDAQEAFHYGWLATNMSKEDHIDWRERFYDITGMTAASFDWEAFRAYWSEHYGMGANAG